MSKVDAPDIEPIAEKKPVPRPRGKYIDFTPRRKQPAGKPAEKPAKKPTVEAPAPKVSVVVVSKPKPAKEPVIEEEPIIDEEIIAEEPVIEEELDVSEPMSAEEILDEVYGPMDDFNDYGDEDEEDVAGVAQEDFISDSDTEDYVEEVLSHVSETRTETTVRRSPFLKNYNIEKRPLSNRIPVKKQVSSPAALEPTPRKEFKEEEFVRRADSVAKDVDTPVVTIAEKNGSRLGVIMTVVITILLGAGVGVFVYLAFFQ